MADTTTELIDDVTDRAGDALATVKSTTTDFIEKTGSFVRQQQRDNPGLVLVLVSLVAAAVGASIARSTRR